MWHDGDIVGVHFEGPLTRADFVAMRAIFVAMNAEFGACYMVSDMTHCTKFEPDARKYLAEWSREGTDKIAGSAVHGVNFAMRALVTLAISAVKFIGKHPEGDLAFVKDHDEALRWIARRRAELAAGA